MKNLLTAFKLFLIMTLLTGVGYPLMITTYSYFMTPENANGSLKKVDGKFIGSILLSQKFQEEKYFWPRPSAVDYNAASSGASNLGPTSQALRDLYQQRLGHEDANAVPQDLLFASGSGLDPHISPAAALFQVERVAKTRGIEFNQVRNLVNEFTEARQFGILGEPRVNVLLLNLALDKINLK
ncbi:MAG TPA: potassium-transporting ATPase subunit KdpC [Pseudobdellovibrionaceae bacterium]|nr:potassium-transporting ATPase subunit KdpC [Pseudobdellovibrionaceae bacterium]